MLTFLYVVHFLVCFILIGVVLLQRGKGQDLGASLGGGGANTIFGSRGAGNFLTKMTTGSAIIFMITSLSLSYLGYKSSDARLFDESEPFVPEGTAVPRPDAGLEEIPAAAGADGGGEETGGLVEVPSGDAAAPAAETAPEAASAPSDETAPADASGEAPIEGAAEAPAVTPSAGSGAASGESAAPAPAAEATPPAVDPAAANAPTEAPKQP